MSDFNFTPVQNEMNDLFVGKEIARGTYRTVFQNALNDDLVVKIDTGTSKTFCNVIEWEMWHELKKSKWAQWLAPCVAISYSGSVLIQKKTTPLRRMPLRLPSFFSDVKSENFGMYRGRVVCHDYGNNSVFVLVKKNIRMMRVKDSDSPVHFDLY